MANSFIRKHDFEKLLNAHWTSFIDGPVLFKRALVDVRNSDYQTVITADSSVNLKTAITVSKFELTDKGSIQIWVEFSVNRPEGHVVGTHIYSADLSGKLELENTFGTIFRH